jgi:prepilin-type N-terminal cleavage/methylation domain-containing protein
MLDRPLGRLRYVEERGFTLIELLIVMLLLSILLTIAVPSYMSFKDRANNQAARANVRDAIPALVAYTADHKTGYLGVTVARLQASYDAQVRNITIYNVTSTLYCLRSQVGVRVWYKRGTTGDVVAAKPSGC